MGTGLVYSLRVIRIIRISAGKKFFLCRDINGMKHLIPVSFYYDYKISAGDSINCRLDKINCQGRFYFEPEHPFYKTNKVYSFRLSGFNKVKSSDDLNIYKAIVIDVYGHAWHTLRFQMKSFPPRKLSSLQCNVISIKKARLILKVTDPRIIPLII